MLVGCCARLGSLLAQEFRYEGGIPIDEVQLPVIGEDDVVYVDCNLIIGYGQSVVAVANAVQESVTAALESMAGVTVASVNVNVCGINRK